jgi:predicted small secreted protein
MKNILVISALVLASTIASSMASAVTVRGSGRYYTGAVYKTIKDACNAATQEAQASLAQKCGILSGTVRAESKITLDPVVTAYEGFCTAFADADCQ